MIASFLTATLPGLLVLIALGGAAVWLGAELLVAGASALALRMGLTPFLVGATVVAFGTSAPELIVSVLAHIDGRTGISLGNVLGSNVCNLTLVLGGTVMLMPMRIRGWTLRRELPLVLAGEAMFAFLALDGTLSLGDGILLLAAFVTIYGFLIVGSRRPERTEPSVATEPAEEAANQGAPFKVGRNVALTLGGLAALGGGARVFVLGAAGFAERMGMSSSAVGATIVALGTSLPELVTSVVAAARGHVDLSLGNLLGSNLFNAMLVGGSLATISAVPVGAADHMHIWWMLATSVAMYPLATYRRWMTRSGTPSPLRLDRLGGLLLLASYAVYIWKALGNG